MSREWTDREVLDILDLTERQGLSAAVVAVRMRCTRSAILGLRYRINAASNEVEDVAKRPENRDGGMPARWWDVPTQHRRRA
jgi:hypothetical protein